MAGPMLIGFMAMVAFNLVDTYFVSKLGTRAMAAMTFTFPVVMVVFSVAFGVGIGASAVVSRAIGAGEHDHTGQLATHALILAVVVLTVFCAVGLGTMDQVFRALGAEEDLIPVIKQYMLIWYIGMPFVVVPIVGNSIIRATGDTLIPAIIMFVGASVNVVLDPLLIFGLWGLPRMELAGAALATVIARAVTFALSLLILHYRKKMLVFAIPRLSALWASWRRILFIGVPACLTNLLATVLMGVMTRFVAEFGEAAVAAVGVGQRIMHFAEMVPAAVASSMVPFVGQNLGAGAFGRIRRALRFGLTFAVTWGAISCVALVLAAWPLARLFSNDPGVVRKIALFLWIMPIGLGGAGCGMLSGSTLNALHRPIFSSAFRVMHVGLLALLAWSGSLMWQLSGLFLGGMASNVLVGAAAAVFTWRMVARQARSAVGRC